MDGDVSMIFFLPDEVTTNTSLIEEALTAEFVQDLAMTLHPVRVDVTLPVLKLSYSADLLTSLSNMGECHGCKLRNLLWPFPTYAYSTPH